MSTDRYNTTPVLKNVNGKRFYKTMIIPNIPLSDTDVFIVTRDGDRLDQLAYRFYGDSTLWWIIAEANGLKDSFYIPFGTRLRVPSNPQNVVENVQLINESR